MVSMCAGSRLFRLHTSNYKPRLGSTGRARQETFERPAGWEDALLVLRQTPGK